MYILCGVFLPLWGTVLGSACVFFMKNKMNEKIGKALTGFAAGVMVAASIWSLIIPALEQSKSLGAFSFIPAALGFWLGVLFLLFLDKIIPHLHLNTGKVEGIKKGFKTRSMLCLAVVLHNIPEGMAVGAVFSGVLAKSGAISLSSAMALAAGIAIQNFPEGAIISMPLAGKGESKSKAFLFGALSGVVEPVGALLTILLSKYIVPLMPYLLSFAAGAMMFVVVEELIPEMSEKGGSDLGTVLFSLGFTLMMCLDVVFS